MTLFLGKSNSEKVFLEPFHTLFAGQTNLSGKTTTIRALIPEAVSENYRVIVFDSKPTIREFTGDSDYTDVPICYRPTTDPLVLMGLLEGIFKRRLTPYYGTLMRLTDGVSDLTGIIKNAEKLERTAKSGFVKDACLTLRDLLRRLDTELRGIKFSDKLELHSTVNIMPINKLSMEAQQLVIKTAFEEILKHHNKKVIVIIDEAFRFLPEGYSSACKRAVQDVITQGAKTKLFVWLASIPGDEVVLARINGLVTTTTFEALYNLPGDVICLSPHHEVKQFYDYDVDVPAPVGLNKSGITWQKVRSVSRHPYNGLLYRIHCTGGTIDTSGNHPIMKAAHYLVRADTLQSGDRLAMRWQQFQDENCLFIGNEDLAWLYGFYAAEGWVNAECQTLLSNSNMDLLERAKNTIQESFHLHPIILEPRKGVSTLQVISPKLYSHFRRLFYNGQANAKHKQIPIEVMNAPQKVKHSFLEGYLAGDGNFDEARNYYRGVTSVSKSLILGTIWLQSSLRPYQNREWEPFPYSLSIQHDEDSNPRYHLTFNKTLERRKPFNEIKAITTYPFSGYLYDLEVESHDHTFYAGIGNIRIHNTQFLAPTEKDALKAMANKLLGRQDHDTEIQHTIDLMPNKKQFKSEDIMTLKRGEFIFVPLDGSTKKVYVIPPEQRIQPEIPAYSPPEEDWSEVLQRLEQVGAAIRV